MKSKKVLNDIFEYLVLFGSREDPQFMTKTNTLCYVLNVDLTERFKQEKKRN